MDPEKISKKAERERLRSKKQSRPVTSKNRVYKTYDAYSFHTYSRIFPGKFNFILWMLLCVPGMCFLILYFVGDDSGAWTLYAAAICIAIFLIRWLIDLLYRIFTFNEYVNFPAHLGFQLNGWDTLGSYPKQLVFREWSKNSTIEIKLKGACTDSQLKVLKDAMYLFVSKANGHFYEAEMGGDGRTKWSSKELIASGSSDIYVIGEMLTLINVYLKSIQEKYSIISSVNVTFDPNIFNVQPPPSSD